MDQILFQLLKKFMMSSLFCCDMINEHYLHLSRHLINITLMKFLCFSIDYNYKLEFGKCFSS